VDKIFGKQSIRRPRIRWVGNIEIFCMLSALWELNPQHRAQWRILVKPWPPAACCIVSYCHTVGARVLTTAYGSYVRCAVRQLALRCVPVDGESEVHCFLPRQYPRLLIWRLDACRLLPFPLAPVTKCSLNDIIVTVKPRAHCNLHYYHHHHRYYYYYY
jgi:hypothetical protein